MNNNKTRVAFFSLIVSVVVLILKTKAYYATHSVAVLSDALETVVNVFTAVMALYAVKFAAQPADEGHPYGHGKFENFSAAFEGGLVFFAGLAIIFKAIESFFSDPTLQDIKDGNIYLASATIVNFLAASFLIQYGKKHKSEALKASGKHVMSDVLTSVGVMLGLLITQWTSQPRLDSVIGFALGVWLLYEAYDILKTNTGVLLDEVDLDAISQLAQIIDKHKNSAVIDVHHLRIIRSGHFHHIDAHMVVPEYWDVAQVHSLASEFEKNVVRDYEYDGEFAFHIDPCKRSFCKKCNIEKCQIRRASFEKVVFMDREHLIKGPQYTNQ